MGIERPQSKQPIPSHAKLVFKGIIFDVYQWEQEMFDGTVTTFEKLARPDTVLVIPVLEDGRILMTKQEQPGKLGFVGLVGGRVDKDESPEHAAARELLEETGYESPAWELWKAYQPVSKVDWAIYMFIARQCRKVTHQQLDSGERIELTPVTFDEFIDATLLGNFGDSELTVEVLRALREPEGREKLRQRIMG